MNQADQYTYENDRLVVANNKYYDSEQCKEARLALQQMVDDSSYDTQPRRRADGSGGFVERHLDYLRTHKVTNLTGYISNLKLMTSIKRS